MDKLQHYNKLINWAMGQHNREVKSERVELIAIYYGAILANACNYRLYNLENDEVEIINFYGLIFLNSGEGKGYAKKIVQKAFQKIINKMPQMISSMALESPMIPENYQKKGPVDYAVSIGSSDIGLYIAGLFISAANIGSLNIEIDEFGDHIGKAENINMLKEAYDSIINAKLIQGDAGSATRKSIDDLPTNLLAYGTSIGIKNDALKMKSFKELTQSGLYRRSYIYHEQPLKSVKKEYNRIDIDYLIDAYSEMPIGTSLIPGKAAIKSTCVVISMNSDASDRISDFQDELIELKNNNLYDDLIPLDEHAYRMVTKVASIVAILNLDKEIDICHIEYAIDLFKRTRTTVSDLFDHLPEFEKIYTLMLNSSEPLLKTDIMKKIGLKSKEFDDNIELIDEFANRYNKRMLSIGTRLKRYSIEEFTTNKLDKMVVSISTRISKEPQKEINFSPYEVPFFGEGMSIHSLLTSSSVQSFCLAHYEPSARADKGHRREDSFIRGQNMIAFDIDEGMTIHEAEQVLQLYTFIIYTTRSHQITKGSNPAIDRFRIVIPTQTSFYVSKEDHKRLYENLSVVLDIPSYDVSTRNVSRLWYTNSEATVIVNKAELLDVRCCLPETEASETAMPAIRAVSENESNIRVAGFLKKFYMNTVSGNRNQNLFNLGSFIAEILGASSVENYVQEANNTIAEPLKQSEVNTIIASAIRRAK